jgi:hypothetical protein
MITKIGLAAGDIWSYLEKNGGSASMDELVVSIPAQRDMALMSIGWLAREGHIVLEGTGPDYTVKLKKQER